LPSLASSAVLSSLVLSSINVLSYPINEKDSMDWWWNMKGVKP
jgi:hypothetical protein